MAAILIQPQCVTASISALYLGQKSQPGTHPTNGISIKLEIRSEFGVL